MILAQYFSVFRNKSICCWYSFELPGLVVYKEVDKSALAVSLQHSFIEIDHKIFSTVILPSADSSGALVSF